MICPLCGERKAKRACPALNRHICAVCCGTKRLVEINCPSSCVYLTTARSHPPAVVQRQMEHDRMRLLPLIQGFSERQARLFLMLAAVIAKHQGETLQTLVDDDIGQAAEALAATLETASRGIVFEHRTTSQSADRLMTELKAMIGEVTREGGSGLERDAVIALRRIEAAAKDTAKVQPGKAEFQQLLIRTLAGPPAAAEDTPAPGAAPSSLILPP